MSDRKVGRDDLGFLLAKAMQRWNELLAAEFERAGYAGFFAFTALIAVPALCLLPWLKPQIRAAEEAGLAVTKP